MALRLTQAGDYAVRAMVYLATRPHGSRILREEIAREQDVPSSFMAKILRSLVNAGLLRSNRGVHGGFTLARPPSQINLLEVVEAIEGPVSVMQCVPDPRECEMSDSCAAHVVWSQVQGEIAGILGKTSIEQLASNTVH